MCLVKKSGCFERCSHSTHRCTLHLAQATFRRRVANKNANAIAESYHRVDKQYLREKKVASLSPESKQAALGDKADTGAIEIADQEKAEATQGQITNTANDPSKDSNSGTGTLAITDKPNAEARQANNGNGDNDKEANPGGDPPNEAEDADESESEIAARQLQQRTRVLDAMLKEKIASGEITTKKAALLRERMVAQFQVPVVISKATTAASSRAAVAAAAAAGPGSKAARQQRTKSKQQLQGASSVAPADAVSTAEKWILTLDNEHGLNVAAHQAKANGNHATRSLQKGKARGQRKANAKAPLFQQRFAALRQQILTATHDKLLT